MGTGLSPETSRVRLLVEVEDRSILPLRKLFATEVMATRLESRPWERSFLLSDSFVG